MVLEIWTKGRLGQRQKRWMGIQVREILGRTLPLSLVVKGCWAQDTQRCKFLHTRGEE
jgi:hypothetical protein